MKSVLKSRPRKATALHKGHPEGGHKATHRVIKFRQELFWDVNPKNIHSQRHARYIIERILDFGNDKEVRWMVQYYDRKLIKDVVERSRVLHAQTRSLWQLLMRTN